MIIKAQSNQRSQVCRSIIERLPRWFGRPQSNEEYIRRAGDLPMFAAWEGDRPIGFVSLLDHNDAATEIVVMGVDPAHHRRGIGRSLIDTALTYVKGRGATILFVRTLGRSHPDAHYAQTRQFYESVGFLPVEELPDLWGPGTPSLLLIKFVIDGQPEKRLMAR
jgi:GNAT superfamily N-acetyltransferase